MTFFTKALGVLLLACTLVPITSKYGFSQEPQFDSYGGLLSLEGNKTGYFHLKKFGDRHFLVTPEGHGYRALGINHFHNMTSRDYDGAIEQIRDWGFNAGCYQGPRWMWKKYPYTKGINLVPTCIWKDDTAFAFKDVFDSEVLSQMESEVRKIVEPQAENAMLIGYFWTDIPVWTRTRNGGWLGFYKSLPEDSAGGIKWREWKTANLDADEDGFLVEIAKQLYAKGHEFVRKYDRNHLIFGDRYHEIDIPESIVREALPYIDAIAIQPTSREFNHDFFERTYKQYGKPIYIADHVSSFATEEYPVTMGQAAKTPEAYSAYYKRYVTSAMSRPYMIGYNKCQYQDQPTPKLLKQGMLRVSEEPYRVVASVREANSIALSHAYKGTEPESTDVRQASADSASARRKVALQITAPADGTGFSTGHDVVITAAADLENSRGRQVRFYYMDKKWELIGKDDTAPFETTWKAPPAGKWDIYVAVHGDDWKILSKEKVTIKVE
ncbi:MAG: hypothetical protein Aurels2KO_34880 [Aureliella sp.]